MIMLYLVNLCPDSHWCLILDNSYIPDVYCNLLIDTLSFFQLVCSECLKQKDKFVTEGGVSMVGRRCELCHRGIKDHLYSMFVPLQTRPFMISHFVVVVGQVLLEDEDYNYNPKFMIIHFSLNKIRLYLYQGQDQSDFNGFLSNHEHEIGFSEITKVGTNNISEAA